MLKKCKWCDDEFHGKEKQVFCSKKCRGQNDRKKNRVNVDCDKCKKVFEKTKSAYKRSKRHYCSPECRYADIGNHLKGNKNPNWEGKTIKYTCLNCGGIFERGSYVGVNKYCSKECKSEHQKETLCGDKNPNYKKNKPNYKRLKERQYAGYREWRMAVFVRDNFNCIRCGRNSSPKNRLAAHHVINHHSYPEGRIDVNNGVTLCFECHNAFHKTYGTIHNDRKQLNEFLKER